MIKKENFQLHLALYFHVFRNGPRIEILFIMEALSLKNYSYSIHLRNNITLTYGGRINKTLYLLKLSNMFKSYLT